ncbi:hypothetical protein BJX70DRAFT_223399 [Aspergillus crustosus]
MGGCLGVGLSNSSLALASLGLRLFFFCTLPISTPHSVNLRQPLIHQPSASVVIQCYHRRSLPSFVAGQGRVPSVPHRNDAICKPQVQRDSRCPSLRADWLIFVQASKPHCHHPVWDHVRCPECDLVIALEDVSGFCQ